MRYSLTNWSFLHSIVMLYLHVLANFWTTQVWWNIDLKSRVQTHNHWLYMMSGQPGDCFWNGLHFTGGLFCRRSFGFLSACNLRWIDLLIILSILKRGCKCNARRRRCFFLVLFFPFFFPFYLSFFFPFSLSFHFQFHLLIFFILNLSS